MNSTIKYIIISGIILLVVIGGFVWYANRTTSPSTVEQVENPDTAIPPVTSESPAFINTVWTALSIENNPPMQGTFVTVQFDDQGRMTGSDGCNTISSSYTIDDSSLVIDPAMISTKMACDEEIMTQADTVTQLLLATTRYMLGDGVLVLYQEDTAGLTFAGQSNSLSKTSWDVTGYNNGKEAVVGPMVDTTLTMTFGDDGTISGTSGCNTFSGQYSLDGQSLTISPLATTLMACIEPEGISEQETAFLTALQNAVEWQIQGNQLSLRTAADELAIIAISSIIETP